MLQEPFSAAIESGSPATNYVLQNVELSTRLLLVEFWLVLGCCFFCGFCLFVCSFGGGGF